MNDRVRFSGQELSLDDVARYRESVRSALQRFFSSDEIGKSFGYEGADENKSADAGSSEDADKKGSDMCDVCLVELDLSSCLSLMASLEASIRIDYLERAHECWNDVLSNSMRQLHECRSHRARLEQDILPVWAAHTVGLKHLVLRVKRALKFRHWLAHGRYWVPSFDEEYDYELVFDIANDFVAAMKACPGRGGEPPASGRYRRIDAP